MNNINHFPIKYKPEEINFSDSSFYNVEKLSLLTKQEREILRDFKDFTNKQIAKKLFLAPHTIDIHRKNIMIKLELKGQ